MIELFNELFFMKQKINKTFYDYLYMYCKSSQIHLYFINMYKLFYRAWCGDEFSVFLSDNGIVMTCGDGTTGCIGHGDWCSTSRPRLIEALLRLVSKID